MDDATIADARAAVRILAKLMPERARMDGADRAFCEDMAYKLNQYGANAQVTGRQLVRLQECLEELHPSLSVPSSTKGG